MRFLLGVFLVASLPALGVDVANRNDIAAPVPPPIALLAPPFVVLPLPIVIVLPPIALVPIAPFFVAMPTTPCLFVTFGPPQLCQAQAQGIVFVGGLPGPRPSVVDTLPENHSDTLYNSQLNDFGLRLTQLMQSEQSYFHSGGAGSEPFFQLNADGEDPKDPPPPPPTNLSGCLYDDVSLDQVCKNLAKDACKVVRNPKKGDDERTFLSDCDWLTRDGKEGCFPSSLRGCEEALDSYMDGDDRIVIEPLSSLGDKNLWRKHLDGIVNAQMFYDGHGPTVTAFAASTATLVIRGKSLKKLTFRTLACSTFEKQSDQDDYARLVREGLAFEMLGLNNLGGGAGAGGGNGVGVGTAAGGAMPPTPTPTPEDGARAGRVPPPAQPPIKLARDITIIATGNQFHAYGKRYPDDRYDPSGILDYQQTPATLTIDWKTAEAPFWKPVSYYVCRAKLPDRDENRWCGNSDAKLGTQSRCWKDAQPADPTQWTAREVCTAGADSGANRVNYKP